MTGLIFDFDGLIMDTEVPVYEAWKDNFAAYGQELPLELYVGCVGSNFGSFDPRLHLESLTSETVDWKSWEMRREEKAHALVEELGPMPGVVEILEEAREAGIPCAVASSSPRCWVDRHLERVGLFDYFELTRCVDDVSAPKPSPELFLSAAEGLGIETSQNLVLEDSLNGLRAAMAAGIPCLAVPNLITQHLDFSGAAGVVGGLGGIGLKELREFWSIA